MSASAAACRTTSQSTVAVIPLPQTRPTLLMDQKTVPSVRPALPGIHRVVDRGMGTVGTCSPCQRDPASHFPRLTQCWSASRMGHGLSPRSDYQSISLPDCARFVPVRMANLRLVQKHEIAVVPSVRKRIIRTPDARVVLLPDCSRRLRARK